MNKTVFGGLFVFLSAAAWAQAKPADDKAVKPDRIDRIVLKNENFLDGRIVGSKSSDPVVLRIRNVLLLVPRHSIERIESVQLRAQPVVAALSAAASFSPASAVLPPPALVSGSKLQVFLKRYFELPGGAEVDVEELGRALGAAAENNVRLIRGVVSDYREKDTRLALAAIAALGLVPTPESTQALSGLINLESVSARKAVAASLRKHGSEEAAEALGGMLADPDIETAAMAREAIKALHEAGVDIKDILANQISSAQAAPHVAMLAGGISAPWVRGMLLELLRSNDPSTLQNALAYLPANKEEGDERIVKPFLNDPHSSVRKQACLTLGKMGARSAIPDLIELLKDGEAGVRENALWALHQLTSLKLEANYDRWKQWLRDQKR